MSARRVGPLTSEEKKYIQENCLDKTDADIAKYIDRDVRTVCSYRKRIGIEKGRGGKIKRVDVFEKHEAEKENEELRTSNSPQSKKDRVEYYRMQIRNSVYYETLKSTFSDRELEYYLEAWADLSLQFSDVIQTEKRQIDELIKAEIMGNRVLANIKLAEEELETLAQQVDEIRKQVESGEEEEEMVEEKEERLMAFITRLGAVAAAMSKDYQSNVELRRKIMEDLNARRRDRAEEIKKTGTNFLSMLEAYRNNEVRKTQGRHMELLKIARENKMAKWRGENVYPDGSKDSILLDSESQLARGIIEDKMSRDLLSHPQELDIETVENLKQKEEE